MSIFSSMMHSVHAVFLGSRPVFLGLLLCLQTGNTANQGLLTKSGAARLLDSTLSVLNMSRNDFFLPPDVLPADFFRLHRVTALFEDPLSGFNAAGEMARAAGRNVPGLLKMISDEMDWAQSTEQPESIHADSTEVSEIPPDFPRPLVLFLAAAVTAARSAQKFREMSGFSIGRPAFTLSDSMLLMADEEENLNVFELKQNETESLEQARLFFDDAARFSMGALSRPAFSFFAFLDSSIRAFAVQMPSAGMTPGRWETPFGPVFVGGPGADEYTRDFFLIIDPGGDDRYLFPSLSREEAARLPLRCIIDLSGNDIYRGGDYSFGCGFFGISALFDKSGDDTYAAGDYSLGSGLFGFGMLQDLAGNDTYSGRVCTQGQGAFGAGVLMDGAGDDLYRCSAQAQGFGFTGGWGGLIDLSGSDVYLTTGRFLDFLRYQDHYISFTQGAGLGYRPLASGGIGALIDLEGNDVYSGDIFAQGTAYWYALGVLYDGKGQDSYHAYQYAQGAGVHLAFGLLLDSAGNDEYRAHGVSQGCGHDMALGGLIDFSGNDVYHAFGLSLGGGNANALSLFLDVSGDDAYTAVSPDNTMGYSDFRRDYGMIGLFADGGGRDLYGDTLFNQRLALKSTLGVFSDMELGRLEVPGDSSRPGMPDSALTPLAGSLDSLFIQASAAPEKFQYNVGPARKAITAWRGEPGAVPFLAGKLGTESARERHALRDILETLYEKDSLAVARLLSDSLHSAFSPARSMAADVCGRKQVGQCLPGLAEMLRDTAWQVRAVGALGIGKIGIPEWADTLWALLADPHPHVAMRAAFGLGNIFPPDLAGRIPLALDRKEQIVRNAMIQGIITGGRPLAMPFFLEAMENLKTVPGKRSLALLLPHVRSGWRSRRAYRRLIKNQPPAVRQTMYLILRDCDNAFWRETTKRYMGLEPLEALRGALK